MKRWSVIVIFALVVIPAVGFVWLVAGTPSIILFAAIVPALCSAGLLVLIDRYEQEPGYLLLASFLWGAVIAAFLSSTANDVFHTWAVGVVGEGGSRSLTPLLGAPVIEEAAKSVALLPFFLCELPVRLPLNPNLQFGVPEKRDTQ